MLIDTVQSSNNFIPKSETRFDMTINNSSKAFMLLSDSLYTDPLNSIMRELVSNAVDASLIHRQLPKEKQPPIIIHLPENIYDDFFIQDFGVGMSLMTVLETFDTYFNSTKETSADDIGGFGLGGKTPFLYTNEFIMETTSPEDGIRRTFVYRTDHVTTEDTNDSIMGKPYNSYLQHLDVVDSNLKGTKISFKLKSNYDIIKFYKTLSQVVFFDYPIKLEYQDYTLNDYLGSVGLEDSMDFIHDELNTHQLCILSNNNFPKDFILGEANNFRQFSMSIDENHFTDYFRLSDYVNVRLGGVLYTYNLNRENPSWKKYIQLLRNCAIVQFITQLFSYENFINNSDDFMSAIQKTIEKEFVVILDNKVNGLIKLDVSRENIRKTEQNTKIITEMVCEKMDAFIKSKLDIIFNQVSQIYDEFAKNTPQKSIYHYFNARILGMLLGTLSEKYRSLNHEFADETVCKKYQQIQEKINSLINNIGNSAKGLNCFPKMLHKKRVINHKSFIGKQEIKFEEDNFIKKDDLIFGKEIYAYDSLIHMFEQLFDGLYSKYHYSLHFLIFYLKRQMKCIHTISFNNNEDKSKFNFKHIQDLNTLLALKIVDEKTKQKRNHVVLLVDYEHVNKPFELVNTISASTLRETYESLKKSKSKKAVKTETEKAITQKVYTRTIQSVNIDEAKDIIANGYKDFTIFIPKELPMNTSSDKLDSALLFKLFKMESEHYNPMASLLKNEKYTYMDYMLELLKPYMVLVELDDFKQIQSNGDLHPKYPILFQMKNVLDNILIKSYQEIFDISHPVDIFLKNIDISDEYLSGQKLISLVIVNYFKANLQKMPFQISNIELVKALVNDKFIDFDKDWDNTCFEQFKEKATEFITSTLNLDVGKDLDKFNFSIQQRTNELVAVFKHESFQTILYKVAFFEEFMKPVYDDLSATAICKNAESIPKNMTYSKQSSFLSAIGLKLGLEQIKPILEKVSNNIKEMSTQYCAERGYNTRYLNFEYSAVLPFLLDHVLSFHD